MNEPPDTISDELTVQDFLDDYAAGKHMASWYINLDRALESCRNYVIAELPAPNPGTFDWIDELGPDPSET